MYRARLHSHNEFPLRFSEIAQAVPQLSDRLLSERMKQLGSDIEMADLIYQGERSHVADYLAARGWDVRGVEPSQWAAGVAIGKGHRVHHGTLGGPPPDFRDFAVITMWDTLEHYALFLRANSK